MMYGQAWSFNVISSSISVQVGDHSRPKHVGLNNHSRNHLFVPLQFLKRILNWSKCFSPKLPQPLQPRQKRELHQVLLRILMKKGKKIHPPHHPPTPATHQMMSVPHQQHHPLWWWTKNRMLYMLYDSPTTDAPRDPLSQQKGKLLRYYVVPQYWMHLFKRSLKLHKVPRLIDAKPVLHPLIMS